MIQKILMTVLLIGITSCSLFDRKENSPQRATKDQVFQNTQSESDKSGLKFRLMVLPFIDKNPQRPEVLRSQSRTKLMIDLNRTGRVMAVQAEDFKVAPELNAKTQDYDLAKVAESIRTAGVSGVMEGQIVDFRVKRSSGQVGLVRNMKSTFECLVRIRIVSARAGKEIFNVVKTVTLEQDDVRVAERVETDKFIETHADLVEDIITEAFLEFTPQIVAAVEKLPWEGRIAALQGERIFLNVGRISGLRVGDILRVLAEGDEIFDPESGQRIGEAEGRLKGTLEVVGFFGQDGSITVIHSGAGFKENDRVEIY